MINWYEAGSLPPVGEKVLFTRNLDYYWDESLPTPEELTEVEVIAHRTTTHGNKVAIVCWDDEGAFRACGLIAGNFKPVPSDFTNTVLSIASFALSYAAAEEIAYAIVNGKIDNVVFTGKN